MSSGFAAFGSHADVSTMLGLVVHAVTEGPESVNGPDAAKGHVDVCGQHYH